ncbi:putative NAD dependent epimerase/dehydratase [Nemania sp. FL0916]|nr:putative NAD dependent epimerase/dehydratase [Nemania sp. FL0916]
MATTTANQPQPQRIFITGASGYIGSRVIAELLPPPSSSSPSPSTQYVVRGLSRSEAGSAKLRALGATPVSGTLASLDILRAEAARADVVVHLADAWIDDFSQPYENVIRIDGKAVDALMEGLADIKSESEGERKKKKKLFIGTSGVGVVAPDAQGGETDETAPANPSPMNGRIHCERHILQQASSVAAQGGKGGVISVAVMRLPPFVYGRGGSGVRLFMDIFAKLGYVARVGDGEAKTSVVHVDDAARAYVRAIVRHTATAAAGTKGEKGDGEKELYNVTASTQVTFRDFTDAIAATLRLPVREMDFEEAAATAGPLVAGFFSDRIRGNSGKARRELGWIPSEVGIVEDIREGSYVQVMKEMEAAAAAAAGGQA